MDQNEKAHMGGAASANDTGPGAGTTALFTEPKGRRTDNKTVTFGDAGAVTSLPLWSVAGVIFIFAVWYITTTAWGFPDDFKATVEPGLSDRELFRLCSLSDECDIDSFTQIVSPLVFPSMRDTWNAATELFSDGYRNISLWTHTWASLWRVIRGMFWGSLFGIPVGLAMGLSSRARGFFDPLVESFRPIPPLALLPLFVLSFGIGDKTAVPLLIFASIWIMIIAARAGMRNASLPKVRASYSLGASKRQLLTKVLLPNALPEIFTGLRVALGVSWGTLVAAELSGVADGLGAMISQAKNFSRLDVIVVGIVIIAVIGVLMDILLRVVERLLIPWQGKT
ncbi:MAG: ABC transporter permease [Acidimicrobiales bacterium]|nr:ABC transporter permease [Acidimicrobiales bacterium]